MNGSNEPLLGRSGDHEQNGDARHPSEQGQGRSIDLPPLQPTAGFSRNSSVPPRESTRMKNMAPNSQEDQDRAVGERGELLLISVANGYLDIPQHGTERRTYPTFFLRRSMFCVAANPYSSTTAAGGSGNATMGLPIRESIKIDRRRTGRLIVFTVLLLGLPSQFLDRLLSLNQMVSFTILQYISQSVPKLIYSRHTALDCRTCGKQFIPLFRKPHPCSHCGYSYCSDHCSDHSALMPRRGIAARQAPGSNSVGVGPRGGGYEMVEVCGFCFPMLQGELRKSANR